MNDFRQVATDIFISRRWRLTAGVRNILQILAQANVPLTVQQIGALLQKDGHKVDPTTVYRILEKLESVGLVHSLRGQFIKCSNPNEKKQEHHFLLCEKCGQAEEIFLDYQESIARQLAQEKNFVLRDVEMYFWGICKHCSK